MSVIIAITVNSFFVFALFNLSKAIIPTIIVGDRKRKNNKQPANMPPASSVPQDAIPTIKNKNKKKLETQIEIIIKTLDAVFICIKPLKKIYYIIYENYSYVKKNTKIFRNI